jgi:cysteine sulfinate desulfinase/cysteine desulfurase-like protein
MIERIYFDNAAATPLAPFAAENFDTCDCHIVTSAIGRPVVLETCRYLARRRNHVFANESGSDSGA